MSAKSVLVTGAASGIGLACVKLLLSRGYSVVAFDIQGERLENALPGDAATLVRHTGDVADAGSCTEAVAAAVQSFGKLDAAIHWGAAHSSTRWDSLTPDEMNRILAVNVTGSFLIAKAAASHMIDRGEGGAIVLTASGSVHAGAAGGEGQGGPAYVSSKGGVMALTRSLARSFGPHDIRVNAVSPGVTDTPMIAGYTNAQRESAARRGVLGTIGSPEEIAAVGVFLITEDARYITGEVVNVNGGASFT